MSSSICALTAGNTLRLSVRQIQRRAQACTVIPRIGRRLRPGPALWEQVTRDLKVGYSPEQIAGTLARGQADTPALQVSSETIYTAIDARPRGALRTAVIGWLRFGQATRRPRASGEDRRGRIPTGQACMSGHQTLEPA